MALSGQLQLHFLLWPLVLPALWLVGLRPVLSKSCEPKRQLLTLVLVQGLPEHSSPRAEVGNPQSGSSSIRGDP